MHWGEGTPRPGTSAHEHAHYRVCKSLGYSGNWQHVGDQSYWESEVGGNERDAAIIEAGGYLAGGGDSDNDRRAARKFAKAAKVSLDEVEAEARRHSSGGAKKRGFFYWE